MEERNKLYTQCREDLLKRQLSNSENFDRSILSLSTGGLGFSLIFIKDIVPLSGSKYILLLKLSWFLFSLVIISTISSFIVSQIGIDCQLNYARRYYLEYKDEFLAKTNWPAKITVFLNYFSGIIFVLAILFTIIFVLLNI